MKKPPFWRTEPPHAGRARALPAAPRAQQDPALRGPPAGRPGRRARGLADRDKLAARLEELRGRLRECDWADADLLVRAAGLCAELGRRDEAVNMLGRALGLDRNNAYARARLAELCGPEEIREMKLPAASQALSRDFFEPFRYALRGNGWVMIVAGAVCFGGLPAVTGLVAAVPLIGLVLSLLSWLVVLAGVIYLPAYLRKVIRSTATDAGEAPDWPDLEEGIIGNFCKMLLLGLVPLGPALFWEVLAAEAVGSQVVFRSVHVGLVCLGMSVFPMVLLLYCVTGWFILALNPARVLGGIARAGGEYWRAVLIWWAAGLARWLLMALLGNVPVLGALLSAAVTMYFLLVAGRALGLVYQSRAERLGWY